MRDEQGSVLRDRVIQNQGPLTYDGPITIYSYVTNQLVWVGYPPFFRSFGIKDLGGGFRQVFGFKGLAGKVFKNQ